MKNRSLKILTVAFCLCTAAFINKTMAQNPSGTCGANLTWELDLNDGTLTISGTGAMYDYNTSDNWVPWFNADDPEDTKIKTIIINDGVTTLSDFAFYYCYKATSVSIGNTVTKIGYHGFSFCHQLTSVTIPNSVITIGDWAFGECEKLTSVIIGNSVTTIGYGAFVSCEQLTSVTLGNAVATIGEIAFDGCERLLDIVCKPTIPPAFHASAFQNVPVTARILVPCGKAPVYQSSTWGIIFTNIIENCDSVGIVETHCNASLRVYPNPTKGELRIEKEELRENSVIEIFNIAGQNVGAYPCGRPYSCGRPEIIIDVSHLAKGMYYLKVGEKTVQFVKE